FSNPRRPDSFPARGITAPPAGESWRSLPTPREPAPAPAECLTQCFPAPASDPAVADTASRRHSPSHHGDGSASTAPASLPGSNSRPPPAPAFRPGGARFHGRRPDEPRPLCERLPPPPDNAVERAGTAAPVPEATTPIPESPLR